MERIGPEHAPALQRLMERSAEFFVLVDGAPPAANAAEEEIASRAPGKTAADETFCLAEFDGDRLIAFANVIPDYPKPLEWWLGLLLIDPAERGRGLGAELHREIVSLIVEHGGTTLWLGVQAQNEAGERFWRRIGYEERKRQPYTSPTTGYQSTVILMSIRTTPSSPSR